MDLGLAGRAASSPAPAAGSAARPRGCSAPRAPPCCWLPAARSGWREAAEEAAPREPRPVDAPRRLPSTSPTMTPASGCWPRRPSASAPSTCSSTTPAPPSWRDLDDVPDEDWRAQYELNVMAPLRAMRAAAPAMAERGWGRIVNVCSTAGKRPSAAMPEYSVAKAAELSLSRLFADRYAEQRRPRQRDLPRPGRLGDVDGAGRPARPVAARCPAPASREEALKTAGVQAPDRPPRRGRRDRRSDRLPLLRARLLRQRRRLVGRRRHRPGDHLTSRLSPDERESRRTTRRPAAALRLAATSPASSSPSAAPTCAAMRARSRSRAGAGTHGDADLAATALREAAGGDRARPCASSSSATRCRPPRPSSPATASTPSSAGSPTRGSSTCGRTRPRSRPSSPSRSTSCARVTRCGA